MRKEGSERRKEEKRKEGGGVMRGEGAGMRDGDGDREDKEGGRFHFCLI